MAAVQASWLLSLAVLINSPCAATTAGSTSPAQPPPHVGVVAGKPGGAAALAFAISLACRAGRLRVRAGQRWELEGVPGCWPLQTARHLYTPASLAPVPSSGSRLTRGAAEALAGPGAMAAALAAGERTEGEGRHERK